MPNNMVLLERIELNASAASITFANIPQTGYTDLKIVVSARNTDDYLNVSFNGSTSNLSSRTLGSNSSGAFSISATTGLSYGLSVPSSFTANTFSNVEIYIPNYTGSTNKSYSIDAVTENNGTAITLGLIAGLWSNTAAITSITLTSASSNLLQYSTFSLYGLAALGTTPAIAPKASGGNIIDFDGTYWIHTFLSSGTFTPQTRLTCDYLVLAGGGGGGGVPVDNAAAGGGGAGGFRSTVTATGGGGSLETPLTVASGVGLTVTVGAGGVGGASTSQNNGTNGSNSVFSTITATGGGGGGANPVSGSTGGSGGGARYSGTGGAGTTNQGYAGGSHTINNANFGGAGGGGAGAVGASNTTSAQKVGGAGGAGVATVISGTSVTRGGGGGGGSYDGSAGLAGGAGGSGGGGAGATSGSNAVAATANLGGGGGGGSPITTPGVGSAGGTGGSGIVIIRYLAA